MEQDGSKDAAAAPETVQKTVQAVVAENKRKEDVKEMKDSKTPAMRASFLNGNRMYKPAQRSQDVRGAIEGFGAVHANRNWRCGNSGRA